MKRIAIKAIVIVSIVIPCMQYAATVADLQGSFTTLPKELKDLSMLDGAIALKTQFIRRLRTMAFLPQEVNRDARSLIKAFFHVIPGTEDVKLAQPNYKNDPNGFINKLCKNLAYLVIFQQLDRPKNLFNTIKDNIQTFATAERKETFLNATYEIARLTLLAALWEYREKIKNFDYEPTIKNALISACSELEKEDLNQETREKLDEIKSSAEKIAPIPSSTEAKIDLLPPIQPLAILDEKNYEQLALYILSQISDANHPPLLRQAPNKATVIIAGQMHTFPDCLETTIRNIINLLAHDEKTGDVSAKILKQNAPNVLPEVLTFYEKYNHFALKTSQTASEKAQFDEFNAHSQKHQNAYNEWAQLLSNLPNITYSEGTHNMSAGWPNLIIAVNYLLGHETPSEYPSEPLTFAKEHISNITELFTATSSNKSNQKIEEENKGEVTIVGNNNAQLTIHVKPGHGYATYKTTDDIADSLIIHESNFAQYPMLRLLIPIQNQPTPTPSTFISLYAHPIDDENFAIKLPKNIKNIPLSWVNNLENIIKHADETREKIARLHLYQNVLEAIGKTKDTKSPTKQIATLKKILTQTVNIIKQKQPQDSSLSHTAFILLENFIAKGLMLSEIAQTAQELLLLQTSDSLMYGKILFQKLFNINQGFDKAIEIINSLLQTDNYHGQRLLEELFKYQEKLTEEQITQIGSQIEQYVTMPQATLRDIANLVETMINQEFAPNIAAQTTKNLFKADLEKNEFVSSFTFDLFKKLFAKNQGFTEALEAAKETDHQEGLSLLNKLVAATDDLLVLEQAAKIGKKYFKIPATNFFDIETDLGDLFITLINKNSGSNALVKVAREKSSLSFYSKELLQTLLEKLAVKNPRNPEIEQLLREI